jgi:hypothetical protein
METPKEYYYTYYSYEEWGRGYFGSRKCYCLPEEDINYLGSFKDKTFNPKHKIILRSDYTTREEAYTDEIILQEYYKVVENPHFANRAYQTSTKFYFTDGSIGGKKAKELGVGVHSLSKKQLSNNGRKGGSKTYELGIGVHSRTKEEMIETGKKCYELGVGIHGRTKEKMIEDGRKVALQRWICLETGFITNAGNLTKYQRKRGIDTSKRKRIS